MSEQEKQIVASLLEAASKIEKASSLIQPDVPLTKETSTEVRDAMIDAQTAINAAFPVLKVVRRDLFLLQPQS